MYVRDANKLKKQSFIHFRGGQSKRGLEILPNQIPGNTSITRICYYGHGKWLNTSWEMNWRSLRFEGEAKKQPSAIMVEFLNKNLQSTVVQHNAIKITNAKWSPILKMKMDQFFKTSMHRHLE